MNSDFSEESESESSELELSEVASESSEYSEESDKASGQESDSDCHEINSSKFQGISMWLIELNRKVRPLINKLSETFEKYYRPGQELAIDEMMIVVFISSSTSPKNLKAFMNAELSSGYVLKFEIYVGDSGSAHTVVMRPYLDVY